MSEGKLSRGKIFRFFTQWVNETGKTVGYSVNKYWDKPTRNPNKLRLSALDSKRLSGIFGKDKKTFLKQLKGATK